jgi:16S rRNA G966 N2-methylase RsmD
MKPLGVVVVERERHVTLQGSYGGLRLRRSERYGATMVDFYQFDSEV